MASVSLWWRASPNPVILSSTPASLRCLRKTANGRRASCAGSTDIANELLQAGTHRGLGPADALHLFDFNHDQQGPDGGDNQGDAREGVASARAERTGAAGAAKRPGQATALAALNQDQQDQEHADQQHERIQQVNPPNDAEKHHVTSPIFEREAFPTRARRNEEL